MSDTLTNLLQAQHGQSVLQGIANPQLINPLAAQNSAVQAAGNVFGLREKQATQALGDAYRQAVDPATGRFDPLKFNQLAAQDPRTSMAAGKGIESSQTLQGQQFDLGAAERKALSAATTAALAEPDDAKLKAAVLQQAQMLIDGGFPRDRVMASLMNMSSDPAQLRQQLKQMLVQNMAPQTAAENVFGTRPAVGAGGRTEFPVVPSPMSGQPGPVVVHSLSPADLEGTVEVPDMRKTLPDGSPNPGYQNKIPISRRELLTTMGYTIGSDGQLYPPGQRAPQPGAGGGPGGAPTTNFGTGRNVPTPLVGPNGLPQAGGGQGTGAPAAAPAAAPAPVAPQARPVMAPSPADTKLATEAGPLFNAEITNANAVPQRKAILANMLADSKQFSGGTGADFQKEFKRLALTWSPYLSQAYTGMTSNSVAAQESFDKLAAQILQQQQSGAGSDFRMGINVAATPSSALTPQGRELIMAQLAGNEDYLAARAKLANQWPAKSDFAGFQQHVKQLDPRVFQYDNMNTQQATAWLKSLPPATQEEIIKAHKWAADQGVLGGNR